MPSKTELEIQREYWNKEKPHFDTIYSHNKNKVENFLDTIFRKDMYQRFNYTMQNAEPVQNRSFLDVGCGTGRYSFELVNRGCKHVTGIDISDLMIAHCKNIAEKQSVLDKTTFLQGDLLQLHFDKKVDVSIGIGLFDYIKTPLPLLKKMHQSTNDRVIVSFPRFWTWRAPIRKIRLVIRHCPVFFYTKKNVLILLQNAGFTKYTIDIVGKLFCVTAFIDK